MKTLQHQHNLFENAVPDIVPNLQSESRCLGKYCGTIRTRRRMFYRSLCTLIDIQWLQLEGGYFLVIRFETIPCAIAQSRRIPNRWRFFR